MFVGGELVIIRVVIFIWLRGGFRVFRWYDVWVARKFYRLCIVGYRGGLRAVRVFGGW